MMKYNTQRGLIKLVLVIIILILVLSYFGFNLRAIVESPVAQENLGYAWGLVVTVWNNYLERPALYLWNDIFLNLLWSSFTSNLQRIRDGEPTDFELNAPVVPSYATSTP